MMSKGINGLKDMGLTCATQEDLAVALAEMVGAVDGEADPLTGSP